MTPQRPPDTSDFISHARARSTSHTSVLATLLNIIHTYLISTCHVR